MRIAIVHSFYTSVTPSGENTVVHAQVDALRKRGHEVLLADRHTDVEQDRPFYSVRASLAAANIAGPDPGPALSEFQPDVVHVHNLFPNWGTRWLTAWGPKTVATLHNYRTICARGTLWRDGNDCFECIDHSSAQSLKHGCYRDSTLRTLPLAWATRSYGKRSPLLNNAQKLIVLNSQSEAVFRKIAGPTKLRRIPNFVPRRTSTRGAFSSSEPRDWVYVGRLTSEKGIQWLIDNWPSNKFLNIVGSGPLEQLVKDKCRRYPTKFKYWGRLDSTETRSLISASAGLIIPSMWSEGIPTVALEALEAGTPIAISSKCSSAAELTRHGGGVRLDVADGGAGIERALDEIKSNSDIRQRAVETYESSYSEEAWISQIEPLYLQVAQM
ncbi:glycosyltransferase family 4 protein [Rhodococcus ruber]|uniref:glycosyltransferase family 4 protein n=1 Tax=Rhodococcus ruber TaxID=1830 RepID=UPI000F5278B0|nr:glycosyltransferase family 4 protein [Rhodococcus ruber]